MERHSFPHNRKLGEITVFFAKLTSVHNACFSFVKDVYMTENTRTCNWEITRNQFCVHPRLFPCNFNDETMNQTVKKENKFSYYYGCSQPRIKEDIRRGKLKFS